MVKYFWGAGAFAHSTAVLAVACLSPNQYRLTPSLRRVSFFAARSVAALCVIATLALGTSARFGESRPLSTFPLTVPTLSYGLELERFAEVEYTYASDEDNLLDVFSAIGVDRIFSERLVALTEYKALVGALAGHQTAVFRNADGEVNYIAQELNTHEYARYDLVNGTVTIADLDGIQAEYETSSLLYGGNIDTMLSYTSFDEELKARVKRGLEGELPLDPTFENGIVKVVYPVKRDEAGMVVGYGELEAVRYRLDSLEKTAIRFHDDQLDIAGFFTPEGSPARRTWLASPVPGALLSSPYNLRRRHPVLKRIRPHYGTDYAADYGTPILAVSDGIVVARTSTRSNGNFVKIKHDDTYQTQYLHMKAFAPGIRPGSAVEKGQVIGYVGSTGLSSGPHVCFRFWKNGRQVNHLTEDLKQGDDLTAGALQAFTQKESRITELLERA